MSENNNEEIKNVEEKEEVKGEVSAEGEKKGPSKAAKKRAKKKAAKQKKKEHTDNTEIVELQDLLAGLKIEIKPKALDSVKDDFKEGKEIDYKFWKDQPVPQFSEEITEENCAYDEPKPLNEVQQEPYKLDAKLDWCVVDIFNNEQMDEIYTLLNRNYVEDDDNMFRFDYSREFLKWALSPPGWRQDWHVGIRHKDNNLLVGFISAIPANLRVYNKNIPLVEINFLCVHKKLREKRIAPILIQEITRRVHLTNRWQAVYTAGRLLPRPVSICRYYHRSLNPKKLISVGFSHLGPKKTMSMAIKLYKLPEAPKVPGIRAFQAKDVPAVGDLLRNYLNNFKIAPVFTNEEVSHWLIPRDMVINAYVVEDPVTHTITDFVSFYTLPSTIVNHEKYNILKAAYSFYNVSTKTPWVELMNDALIFAKNLDFDVFNCLDAMENASFLKELKFGIGDGKLHYYLYNWKCPTIAPEDLGLVLM